MDNYESPRGAKRVRLLPGEEFQIALEPHGGVFFQPQDLPEVLLLTDLRVIHRGVREGQRFLTIAPLSQVTSLDLRDRQRLPGRLLMGGLLMGIGILVAAVTWTILEAEVLALVIGGIPTVVGIYFLMAFLFSADEGSLSFFTPGHSINFPLRSHRAGEEAYLVVERFWELYQRDRKREPAPVEEMVTAVAPQEGPTSLESTPAGSSGVGGLSQELREKLEVTRGELLQLVEGVSEERATFIPGEGERSVKQTLAHVAEVEAQMVADALVARDGEVWEMESPELEPQLTSHDGANSHTLGDLLERLAQVRQESLAALDTITEEQLLRKIRHQRFGELTVLQLLRAIYRHDRMHTEEMAGGLAALGEATS